MYLLKLSSINLVGLCPDNLALTAFDESISSLETEFSYNCNGVL